MRGVRRGALAVVAVLSATAAMFVVPVIPPAAASEPINGGGSTWSSPAIAQWASDVSKFGLHVNYQPTGSTAGRQGYTAGTYDFAVSEIPFQSNYCTTPGVPSSCYDELTQPGLLARPYVYMPIVAGGTSLLYNLQIDGRQFTHLQLSPVTLTQIFTGQITNWDNPAIAAENPGVPFPNLPIQPVVRADGAGTSYQFTAFMAYEDPAAWDALCQRAGISQRPCPPTSQFPYESLPNSSAQDLSQGVADWVAEPYNNGTIGYAEAAYGIEVGMPVASLENRAGVYVQPTAKNVAVALTGAVINPDNTQNLLGVYSNPDPRAYPMSSYSYMIVPTTDAAPMDVSKGTTLGAFILYFLCQGQQQAAPLGYSPLPPNLVLIGFAAEHRIPGAPRPPPLRECNNPTITDGFLNGIGTPSVKGHSSQIAAASGIVPSGTAAGSTAIVSAPTARTSITTTAGRSRAARSSRETEGSSTTAEAGGVALAVSSPQPFGRMFRPMGYGVMALVIVAVLSVLFGPSAVASAQSAGQRRRSRKAGGFHH